MGYEGQFGCFTGRAARVEPIAGAPLVIAVHGGTYSSAYFDIADHSLLERAAANGIPAIAIDRHGYGGTPFADDMSILGQAAALKDALAELWDERGGDAPGAVLIGHSIGAAITLGVAADPGRLPLLGVAVSGIGVRTPGTHSAMWNALPDLPTVEMPGPIKDQLMFGAPGSFAAAMPAASRVADAPVPKAELVDIVGGWQERAAQVSARVRVPVHYRQGEHDRLWIVDQDEIDAFAARFTAAPRVDAAMVLDTGHCMDFHAAGAALHLQQLGFALQCAAEARGRGEA